jgi:NAD(P)-dependent dehydrogenase (short-subunit alcohol dehydrogenase family)
MLLDNKVTLVTGASQGIGAAIATRFAEEGAHVAITDVRDDIGRELAAGLAAQHSGRASYYSHDVTDSEAWARVVGELVAAHGRIDVLVNNAGIYQREPLERIEESDWDRMLDVNAKGPFLGARAILSAMRAAGGGSIVNLSSTAGIRGSVATHYGASKGAVRLMSKSIAITYAREGIRCNSVHPGPVETDMGYEALPVDLRDERLGRVPLGRFAQPSEIANAVLFLASDLSSFVTGTELIVDGGATAA